MGEAEATRSRLQSGRLPERIVRTDTRMSHTIHRVTGFEQIGDFELRVFFEDGTSQNIDFAPVLHGEILGPLADRSVFAQVTLDEEVHTLVWPTGADFDPATLHDWPTLGPAMAKLAETLATVASQ